MKKSIIYLLCFILIAPVLLPSGSGFCAKRAPAGRLKQDTSAGLKTGWNMPLCNGRGKTILDAARFLFPGGTLNELNEYVTAKQKTLRIPGATKERTVLPKGTALSIPSRIFVKSETKNYTVVLWEGVIPGSGTDKPYGNLIAALGIFPEGSAEPTDVAEVKTDQFTYFGADSLLELGEEEAFTIVNHHANAGQPYYSSDQYYIRAGRLSLIGSVSTLGCMSGCADSFREDVEWITDSLSNENHPDITVVVDLVHAPEEYMNDCDENVEESTESFREVYRWDSGKFKYVKTGGNMERLDKWNIDRM